MFEPELSVETLVLDFLRELMLTPLIFPIASIMALFIASSLVKPVPSPVLDFVEVMVITLALRLRLKNKPKKEF